LTLAAIINYIRKSQQGDPTNINRIIEELHETTPPIDGGAKKGKLIKLAEIHEQEVTSFAPHLIEQVNAEAHEQEMSV